MKRGSKIVCALLACALLGGAFAGCAETDPDPTPEVIDASVWSTYSTAKVTQNTKESVPYAVLNAALNIRMMKDETEGAQLIVTAGSDDIGSYELTAAALSDGNGHTIPAEDVAVYHQKYITVTRKSDLLNTDYLAGDRIPDMLLPMDTAKEYGENKIAAGQNQGITVEVTTASDTVPGTYTGTFVLDLDGEKQNIPVTVEVWDIEYEGRRTFQSSFLLYRNSLVAGEYEASDELVDRYVDFLLDYNVNTLVIKDVYSPSGLVGEAERLWENENFNSLCIPVFMSAGYTASSADADSILAYVNAVVEASSPEKPYFEYLYIYPTYFDEADMYSEKYTDVVNVFKQGGEWDKTLERILADVKTTDVYKNADSAFQAQIEHAVSNIPAVFPNTTFQGDWVASSHVTFCPYLNLLGNDSYQQQYADAAAQYNDGDLWAYTCSGPNYPHPTFHIDDYNLGTRVTGWMAKKFGVNGYLYWSVNMYQAINSDTWRDVDVYETAERAGYCAGDGFLLYPGAYYGSEYPFATNRLAAWRDAMDDYDMLCVYEQLLNEQAETYGITVDFADYVNDLYDSLFNGTEYYTDDALVEAARAELAARILALQGDDGIMAQPTESGMTIYSAQNTLTIDGQPVQGAATGGGFRYDVSNTGSAAMNVTVASASASYTFRVGAAGTAVSFAGGDPGGVTFDAYTKSSVSYAGGKANAEIVAVNRSSDGQTINGATLIYTPFVQFAADGLAGASAIGFEIENTGDADVSFTLYLVDGSGTRREAGSGFVGVGKTRTFRIVLDTRTFTEEILADTAGIRFTFANVNAAGTALAPTKNFALGDITYEIN